MCIRDRCRDNVFLTNIAKQRNLFAFVFRDWHLGTAQKHIRLNTIFLQLLDRRLRRFGFQLAGSRNIRQKRQMQKHCTITAEVVRQLADGFKIRLPFNSAHRTADFAQYKVFIFQITDDKIFNLIGYMGNDLNGRSEIIPVALLIYNALIDFTGGRAIAFLPRTARTPLLAVSYTHLI